MQEYAACELANEVLYMFSYFYSLLPHTAFCSAFSVFIIVEERNYQKLEISEVQHSIWYI